MLQNRKLPYAYDPKYHIHRADVYGIARWYVISRDTVTASHTAVKTSAGINSVVN
jgi:hypothetical protein